MALRMHCGQSKVVTNGVRPQIERRCQWHAVQRMAKDCKTNASKNKNQQHVQSTNSDPPLARYLRCFELIRLEDRRGNVVGGKEQYA